MQRLTLIAALAALGFASSANAANDNLEGRVTAKDGWVAYRVPQIDYPRRVKKQALFWLGQSGSPQAMAYFDAALK